MILQAEEEEAMERSDDEETADHTVYLLPNDLLPNANPGVRETITTKGLPQEIP